MTDRRTTTPGALDIRNVIGALLSVYGVILLVLGLFASTDPASPEAPEGSDVNANLWAGLALLAVGLGFIAWRLAKPVEVTEEPDEQQS